MTGSKRACSWVFTSSLAALLFAAACSGGLPHPNAPDADRATVKWPAVQLTDLKDGRSIYRSKCGGCHRLYLPSKFSPEHWQASMTEMSARAGLNASQRSKLEAYLWSLSSRPVPKPNPEDKPQTEADN